nr:uncharacterized protein C9orf50 homolog [Loxodonta africana]
MLQHHLKTGAQEVGPKGFPSDGDLRTRRDPLLPWLTLPELRAAPLQAGARGSVGPGGPEVGAPWWQVPRCGLPDILVHHATDPGVNVGSPAPRLPALPTVVQRVAQKPAVLGSQLLPPLLSASAPRGLPVSRRPTPGEEDHRRGLAREAPNPLGALLREFLPNRFREFLCRLKSKSASSASQHQVGVSKRCRDSQCPKVSFLPDLRGQPSFFQELPVSTDSLKILRHQTPDLGSLRSDCSQFTTVRKTKQLHSAQSSKLKAVLTHSSSGERLGPRKRCCPFRVRFADETLRDTALRYWERSCAFQQNLLESETATQPVVSEQVFRSVSRWLESLPRALCPGARQEKATASSSWSWDCPSLSSQEPQGSLFDNASMSSSLPRISRATTHKQRGHLRTHLDTHNILEQMGKLPRSWSQKLVSTCWWPGTQRPLSGQGGRGMGSSLPGFSGTTNTCNDLALGPCIPLKVQPSTGWALELSCLGSDPTSYRLGGVEESFLPNLVLQSVLKRGHPKGYQLLLPLKTRPRTQR